MMTYTSLQRFDEDARQLRGSTGLSARIEIRKKVAEGYLVSFEAYVNMSLPNDTVRREKEKIGRLTHPVWRLKSPELDALAARVEPVGGVLCLSLFKGQGGSPYGP